jgi:3-hydroxypropanoate dehydrogenase
LIAARLILSLTAAAIVMQAADVRAQGAFPAPLPGQAQAAPAASPFPPVNGAPASSPFPPVNGAAAAPVRPAPSPSAFSTGAPPVGGGGFGGPPQGGPPPGAADCQNGFTPLRADAEAKAELKPALSEGNIEKTMAAPVTACIAHDLALYEALPRLFPHMDAKPWFSGNAEFAATTAFRNGTLQGAYLIMALRAVGLDTGPMSGFNNALVDEIFFAGTNVKSNFLLNIGYGSQEKLFARSPRFDFNEIAKIV